MVQYKIKSYKANQKCGERRGVGCTRDYQFSLLINHENHSTTIGAADTFLINRKIVNNKQYREFCEEVLRQTMEQLIYDEIKDRWKQNKECIAFVHRGKITYKPSWKGRIWCEVALKI